MKKYFLIVGIALLLTACGPRIEGKTYQDATGVFEYRFEAGGRVYVTQPDWGVGLDMHYELKGNTISVTHKSLPFSVRLTLKRDGTIIGPGGIQFKPKQPRSRSRA